MIKDPQTGEMCLLVQHVSMGFAPRPDGSIMIKIKDLDTELPILIPFDAEPFGEVLEKMKAAYGSRIVPVSEAEVKEFGKTPRQPGNPDRSA